MTARAREQFRQARNYCLYYGYGEVEALSQFDVAIVESGGQTESNIQVMNGANTTVLAYISIMEIAEYDPEFRYLSEDDFLKNDQGLIIKNEVFGTYLLNLNSKRWQGLLFHRIGRLLKVSNYQGLFLDTIGNVEMSEIPGCQKAKQLEEAVALVKAIRSFHPESVIVQNNGLNTLILDTVDWIDGICWENPNFIEPTAKKWNEIIIARLDQFARQKGLKIMLLLEKESTQSDVNGETASKLAKRHGYWLYEAPAQYVKGVNVPE